MAITSMTTSNALAVKRWETKTWTEAIQDTVFGHMFNRGAVYFPLEFVGRKTGDTVTFGYVPKLTGFPVGEGEVAYGNEEAVDTGSHSMVQNITRIPVEVPGADSIEQVRTNILFQGVGRDLITNRIKEFFEYSVFNQLAGANPTSITLDSLAYTGDKRLHLQGHNVPTAPTTNRVIRPSAVANDQSLTSSHLFTLDLIDYAVELSETTRQPLTRLGGQTFDLFISPQQLTDLRQDSTGKIQWYTNQLAYIQSGGKDRLANGFENNMACAGTYNGVNIYSSPRVAYGVRSDTSAAITTVRRAVLIGKDALAFGSAYGGRPSDTSVPLKYAEDTKDYEEKVGIVGKLIYGLKKMSPSNAEDMGVICIPTYAASHGV